MIIFRLISVFALIAGFSIPYLSDESVEAWQMIILQIAFYGIAVWYIKIQ